VGFSYIWGKMTLDQVNLALNPLAIPATWTPVSMVPLLLGGSSPWSWNADQNRIIVETNLDGKGTAYGANAGILFKPSEKFSIGLSGRFSTDLKLKGDMTQTVAYPGDPAKYQTLLGVATALDASDPVKAAQLRAAAGVFSGVNVTTTYKDIKADLPLPWTIGAGIAFKPSCCWTLTADASLTNWSAWDVIEIDEGAAGKTEMLQDWKNTLELGLGVEFLAMQKESHKLFLRAGGYTVDSPVPNETMNPTLLDPARRYVATAGVGLTMGKVSIDFAFEHVFFGEKDIPASEYVFDAAKGYAENYAGKYNFNANVFTLATTISL
jgi:long-chain fatty acid transport protein